MTNCLDCRHSCVEDIFQEWYCKKGHHINIDDDGCISVDEIECEDFEEDKWYYDLKSGKTGIRNV